MVETARGQGGGYRLAKRPDRIFLVEIVDLLEGVRSRPGCFLGEEHDGKEVDAQQGLDAAHVLQPDRGHLDIQSGSSSPPTGVSVFDSRSGF